MKEHVGKKLVICRFDYCVIYISVEVLVVLRQPGIFPIVFSVPISIKIEVRYKIIVVLCALINIGRPVGNELKKGRSSVQFPWK